MYKLVKAKVANAVKKSQLFTIMMDGTTEKMGHELLDIVERYVDDDTLEVSEHVIYVKDATEQGLLKLLKCTSEAAGISLDGVVSQTYDGASVMSGHVGGVQKLFCHLCGREVPYIHCYCHRLKLVIDELLKTGPGVSVLYDFFKLSEIHQLYSGEALKRLIETRWSGHNESIEAVFKEILQIIQCLEECQVNPSVKYGNKGKAEGHLKIVKNPYFILLNKILFEVFSSLT